MSNAALIRIAVHAELVSRLVHSALYRYDDSLSPVPDLAAEPCDISTDGLTITCQLVEATFHDGTPVTADDVAFTYELGLRAYAHDGQVGPQCLFAFASCPWMLESATAIDERTVQFRLTEPNPTFETVVMPEVLIEPRAVIEAAYAPLAERAPTLDAANYEAAAEAIFEQLRSGDPDCAGPLEDAVVLLEAAGVEPLARDQFNRADGTFNECMYAEQTARLVWAVGASLRETEVDAIALAYLALSSNRAPIGAGPFRFVEVRDGVRARYEAYPEYHHGSPATAAIEIVLSRDFEAARRSLLDGDVHWLPIPLVFPEAPAELRSEPGLRLAEFPESAYFTLAYNLRDGMLFSDLNLRTALELCIDKPATVDAATDGTGEPIYSFVAPISWAYHPELPRPTRDVAEARALIESSGWSEGEDGVYTRDGRRLATEVFVTAGEALRVQFMQLVSEQARDCGIELTVVPADFATVLRPLSEYPHIPGGRDEPFEAHFIGWGQGYDPHAPLFHSSSVSSEQNPEGLNFMGYSNERVDELLDAGLATYDQRERAQIYRELQEVIAADKPFLFAWAVQAHDAIDSRLGYVDGEPNFSSQQWFWQLEKLVLREGG